MIYEICGVNAICGNISIPKVGDLVAPICNLYMGCRYHSLTETENIVTHRSMHIF